MYHIYREKYSMHLSRYEKSIGYKQVFRNFPTLCAIMRFFFRNYANYALRAELCDFTSAHYFGSPDFGLIMRSLNVAKCNLGKVWVKPMLASGCSGRSCSVGADTGLRRAYVLCLPTLCVCAVLLWVPFMPVECFCSLTSLPFIGDGKYSIWGGIYGVSPLTLSVWWCLVVAALGVAVDTCMFCLRLISRLHLP